MSADDDSDVTIEDSWDPVPGADQVDAYVEGYEEALNDLRIALNDVARKRRCIALFENVSQDRIARVHATDQSLYHTVIMYPQYLPGELRRRFPRRRRRSSSPPEEDDLHTPPFENEDTPSEQHEPDTPRPRTSHDPTPREPTPHELTRPSTPRPPTPTPPPARRRGRPSVSAQLSADQIDSMLIANLGQPPLSADRLIELSAPFPYGQTTRRLEALANATRGVAADITVATWSISYAPFSDLHEMMENQSAFYSTPPTPLAFARQHEAIVNFGRHVGFHALVYKTMLKLFDITFARRWYAVSLHDPEFPTRFYRQLWAMTPEGRNALANAPDADAVYKAYATQISEQIVQKQQPRVTARNRLLRLCARFGPIVIIDPCWEYDILLNTNHGSKAMNSAIAYYDAFARGTSIPTRQILYVRAEAAILALAGSCDGLVSHMDMIRGQLWELRIYASVAFAPHHET